MHDFDTAHWASGIALSAAGVAAVMLTAYLTARRIGRNSVIDVAWGPAFAAVALISFGWSSGHGNTATRSLLLALPAMWGLRLGTYIGLRQRGTTEDPRYIDMLDRAERKHPQLSRTQLAALKIYTTQGVSVLAISMPVQVGMYEGRRPGALAWAGLALWVLGIFFEGVGDYQLARFKADPHNNGKIMNRGLWSLTRHPNYFGDACVWWGIFLIAAGHWPGWITVFAPLTMNALLAKGTGKKTLEEHMAGRPGFDDYVDSTSGFIPLPPAVSRRLNHAPR